MNPQAQEGSTSSPGPRRPRGDWILPWVVAAIFAGLAGRQLQFVNAKSVNVLYWDQWDFYLPVFHGEGWWAMFTRQHGPHREGVGLVVMRIVDILSGWNSRADAFAESVVLIAAAGLGIRLALRFGIPGRSLALVAIPLVFFDVLQYEIFVGSVNLSHGAMPVLMFMAYCLCWFHTGTAWRVPVISALTFLLIFTGFGIFAGVLTPLILAVEAAHAMRARDGRHAAAAAAGVAACVASGILFARGYAFQPGAPGFAFPYPHPAQYLAFVGAMLGNFFGAPLLSTFGIVLGLVVAAALAAICAWHARLLAIAGAVREPKSVVLFCLSAFTLLYCADTAVGRVQLGPTAPLASRYVTLMIPGALALFLQLAALARRCAWEWPALAFAIALVPGTCFLRPLDIVGVNWYAQGKARWKAAYLETHDEAKADKAADFRIYPAPVTDRLKYLEDRKLNLFRPDR